MVNEYLDFIKSLQELYFEKRDIENIFNSIDENTSWIGTGRQEICKSFSEASQALIMEKSEYDGGFTINESWYETSMITSDVCVAYGEFSASANDKSLDMADLFHRISVVCARTENGIKLLHLHMSTPDDDQENGEYYVKSNTKTDNKTMRLKFAQTSKDLNNRSKELEALTENIPGGVHQCTNDNRFTLVNMSSGFISMFGYNRDEIKSIFDNSFMNMIYQGDRATVIAIMREQLSVGKTVEFEYRVRCKDQSLIWILDRGRLVTGDDGTEYFYCVMIDITTRKAEDEKLRLALERHKIIMDQATDIIFEWDINSDSIDFSSNWEKQFGYPPISKKISENIPCSANIHPDDMHCFVEIMSGVIAGIPYSEAEFRIQNITNNYTWCRIRATTQFDNDQRPIKAVGVIVNIEKEKNKSNILLEAAQSDSLTHLYNKSTTEEKVYKSLNESSESALHALMIIDVDNFKNINDQFGHQCGDAVLSNMAKSLKKLFRISDVVGRIGGDEFLVFMSNATSKELIATKAKEIVQIFNDIPTEIGSDLSCSVGISLYPHDGSDYSTLSRCADKALYRVKHRGKLDFGFYDKNLCDTVSYSPARTAISEKIESEEENIINQDLVQLVFQLLYDTVDVNASINHILETVGRAYDVSRAYIFENSEDGKYCSNTFEWCNTGVTSEINKLQNLSFETDLPEVFDLYDKNGIFYCQDIKKLSPKLRWLLEQQGIISILQCVIKDGGVSKGYIGFDECIKNRYWTKEQINTLSYIGNVISTFLIKQRLKEQLLKIKANSAIAE